MIDYRRIQKIAMILLGQINHDATLPEDQTATTPTQKICEKLYIVAVTTVLEAHPWSFARVRLTINTPSFLNKNYINMDTLGIENPPKNLKAIIESSKNKELGGATALYELPSEHPADASIFTRYHHISVYNADWNSELSYENKQKWWMTNIIKNSISFYSYIAVSEPYEKIFHLTTDNDTGVIQCSFSPLNIECFLGSPQCLDSTGVSANFELCCAYYLAHLACGAITGSGNEATRLLQMYRTQLEICKAEDTRRTNIRETLSLTDNDAPNLLSSILHA